MVNTTSENSTYTNSLENFNTDNSLFTFSLGFGILLIIILFGVLGSAFLCLSLEKDPGNLWPVESSMEGNQDQTTQEDKKDGEITIAEIV